MKTKIIAAFAAAALGAIAGSAASASTVERTYTDLSGPIDGQGQFELSGPNGVFGDTITAITGTFLGQTITGLVADPGAPLVATNFTGNVVYDNNVDPVTPAFDYYGVEFTVSDGTEYNLYGVNAPVGYVNAGPGTQALNAFGGVVNTGTRLLLASPNPPPGRS